MTAHADDIAALRRLLEGVEGFAAKAKWRRIPSEEVAGGWWMRPNRDGAIGPEFRGVDDCDIALAVGVTMEMLRERHGVRHLGRLIAEAVPDDAEFGSKGSPRLLPLLADVLCGAGREEATDATR